MEREPALQDGPVRMLLARLRYKSRRSDRMTSQRNYNARVASKPMRNVAGHSSPPTAGKTGAANLVAGAKPSETSGMVCSRVHTGEEDVMNVVERDVPLDSASGADLINCADFYDAYRA
jgi:hypothetical protein